MCRTANITDEIIVVSHGEEDTGKLAMLGANGKFHASVIPVIDDLQTQITAEVTARTAADTQLQANIDSEVSARTNADTKLQSNIDAEASARSSADQDLQAQITAEAAARTAADTTLQSSIDTEVAARTAADETEATTRASADENLQAQINVLDGKYALSNVVVNGTTIAADSQSDTLELAAGTNIALAADVANKKVTIAVTGQVASAAQADSAAKLTTARTISLTGDAAGSASFDGSADMSIAVDVNNADNAAACSGNAATATKLETARAINGVAFDGSADITITAKADGGDSDTLNGKSASDIIAACSSYMPVGGIIMWSGSTIPSGWALCDGSNGTPNLKGKFVLGYNDTYSLGTTGGEETHQLTTAEMPAHNHLIYAEGGWPYGTTGSNIMGSASTDYDQGYGYSSTTGSGTAHNNMPPYYALAYIMRTA